MYTYKQIKDIDPEFDWKNVYYTNYFNLKNIRIHKFATLKVINVNGEEKTICYNKPLYAIVYRKFMNPNWFMVEEGEFFTSEALAMEWFETKTHFAQTTEEIALERTLERFVAEDRRTHKRGLRNF